MTIDDLLHAASQHTGWVLIYFAAVPGLAWATGRLHTTRRAGAAAPYGVMYGTLIYLVSVPGMLAAVLTGYGLLFLRADLRGVPIVLYFVPIASMLATWGVMRRQVELDAVPGFGRLSGLMLLLALCFAAAFILNRLFFGVLFFGSLWGLGLIALAGFFAFRIALRRIGSG